LILRYNVQSTSGAIQINPTGRFGGNAFSTNGRIQFFFQQVGADVGPWGPNIAVGCAWFLRQIAGEQPVMEIWLGAFGSGGVAQFTIMINNAGKLELRHGNQGTLLATGTTIMTVNQYYYIEFSVHIDTAAGTASAQIDGVNQFTVAGINTQDAATAQFDSVLLFINGFSLTDFDDWYVKDTLGMLGERRVVNLRPNADGAPLQWTPSAGVTHFNLVNEVPPDDDATYVEDSTPTDIDTYGMDNLPYNPAHIDTIQTSMFARKTDAGLRQVSVMVSGTTSAVVVTLTSTFNDYIEMWDLDPLTGLAWTFAGVNGMTTGINEIA
jgi:hypothetical protein